MALLERFQGAALRKENDDQELEIVSAVCIYLGHLFG